MARNRWVKVIGDDGTFFDLVMARNLNEHIAYLKDGGYDVEPVYAADVPPCTYRDFTMGEETYTEQVRHGGKYFYIEEEEEKNEENY